MKRLNFRLLSGALCAAALLFSGCQSAPEPPPPVHEGPWTPSQLENQLGGPDPIEGFNRAMFTCTDVLMDYLIDPLGRVYTTILPRPVIEKIDNACVNLEYPGRVISCLGRAEWRASGDETMRFLLNTTVGIAGLFDPAAYYFDIYSTESDFGQMFATWGIGPGCTLLLPLSSKINVRDTVGGIFDIAFDAKTYIPFAGWATAMNRAVVGHRAYSQAVAGSADRYKTYRELALLRRQLQQEFWFYHARNEAAAYRKALADGVIIPEPLVESRPRPVPAGLQGNWVNLPHYFPQNPIIDTMRVAMFRPQEDNDYWYMRLSWLNSDFIKRGDWRKLSFDNQRPRMPYGFWPAPIPEDESEEAKKLRESAPQKIVFVVPGIGGAWNDGTTVAFAELLHNRGTAVVTLNSAFAWQLMVSAGDGQLPGYVPDDVAVLRKTIARVLEDLAADGLITRPEPAVLGYSLGGLHTLHLAAAEEQENTLGIRRYVAVNPPVDLGYALGVADGLAQVSAAWQAQQAIDVLTDAAGKQMMALARPFPSYDPATPPPTPFPYTPPVSDEQARYLASLYFRMSLRSLLFRAHDEKQLPELINSTKSGDRNALYLEIDQITFQRYVERFLLDRFQNSDQADAPKSFAAMAQRSGLPAIAPTLRNSAAIRVFHSYDDFLLNDPQRKWLDTTLGKRLTWFDHGGHLGNLYITTVQASICDAVLAP